MRGLTGLVQRCAVVVGATALVVGSMAGTASARPDPPPVPPAEPPSTSNEVSAAAAAVPELPPGGTLRSLPPTRVLDTRDGTGVPPGKVPAQGTIVLDIAGRAGVPADGASAVVLNVTATEATQSTYVTVWPEGPRPATSNLNVPPGVDRANLVQVGLGADGAVRLYNNAGTTHLVADVMGWIVGSGEPDDTGRFHPLVPSRVLDTRDGNGAPVGALGPQSELTLQITGRGGVPEDGVSAVAINLTSAVPTASTYVSAWPADLPRPLASVLNTSNGRDVPNRVIVQVSQAGAIKLYNNAGSTHLVADVVGWYGQTEEDLGGASFTPLAPFRVVDTRDGTGGVPTGRMPGGTSFAAVIAGKGGVPSMQEPVPPSAVVVNLTAAQPLGPSYFTLWPTETPRPLASDLNMQTGVDAPNLAIAKLGPDGGIQLYNNAAPSHAVIDVLGYFSGDVAVDPSLRVLTAAEASLVTSFDGTVMTFSTPPAGLTEGMVLSSDITDAAPFGFLVRVVAIDTSGGVTTVFTEPVSLDEVIAKGGFSGSIPLIDDESVARADASTADASTAAISKSLSFNRSLEGTAGGGTATASLSGEATVTAEDPYFDVDFDAFPSFKWDAELSAQFVANAQLAFEVSGQYELTSKRYELAEIGTRTVKFAIGPVPVIVQPQIELEAEVRGRLEAGYSATLSRQGTLEVGFRASDSAFSAAEFDPYADFSDTGLVFDVDPPSATVTATAQLFVSLEMEFYGILELGVGVAPTLQATVSTDDCLLRSALRTDAFVNAELEIIGKDVLNKEQVFEDVLPSVQLHEPIAIADCSSGGWEIEPLDATSLANLLADNGIQVVGASIGGGGQAARFASPDDGAWFRNGVVLSSGFADGAPGPNDATGFSGTLGTAGSPAIEAIVGSPTYDASSLRIDFVPSASQIEIDWQFGSDEYTEYVNSAYNDAGVILVNGANCAVVGSGFSNVPATVNAVNPGSNASQYLPNEAGQLNIQADGLTKGQRCLASVTPGVVNTMIIEVADTSDQILDSWMFIQANSFDSPPA